MAVDTPARIVILGAGPIGLEAALYARFLGYDVAVFERAEVANHVRKWGHVRLFTPFAMNSSSLARAALAAQDPDMVLPDENALLTGTEWAAAYLIPLSQTDLLADHVHAHTTVRAVGRDGLLKHELPGDSTRDERPFRLLVEHNGTERIESADVVIDTTGVFGNPNWLGGGGIPAVGERSLAGTPRLRYDLPDILGRDREDYEARHTLLIGAGYSAATSAVALAELCRKSPGTRATWITRRAATDAGPVIRIENDPLAERARLAAAANRCACDADHGFEYRGGRVVEAVLDDPAADQILVQFDDDTTPQRFDRVVANVGYHPDRAIYAELQVHECYASDGPMKLAAAILGSPGDCLAQISHGAESLQNPEPDFYVLGSKSYGRNSHFLFSLGLQQIRELFSLIGDRATLDLYAGASELNA